MNKNLVVGLFAAGLIVAGGTGYYMAGAKDNSADPQVFMQQQGMGNSSMVQMMNTTNTKEEQPSSKTNENTFEQMLPYMKQMHPNLSDKQLKSLYEDMMGENGSQGCGNFQGMMGNFNDDTTSNTTNTTNTGL